MVIGYALAPKSLPCNHLRILLALILPRWDTALCSHGTEWLPAQQMPGGMLNLVLSMTYEHRVKAKS